MFSICLSMKLVKLISGIPDTEGVAGHVQHPAHPRVRVRQDPAGRSGVPVRPGRVLPLPVPIRREAEMYRPEMPGERLPLRVRSLRQGGPHVRRQKLRAPVPAHPAVRAGSDLRREPVHAPENCRSPDDKTP